MDIEFDHETPDGVIKFRGSIDHAETTMLLKFAILTLLAQGALPMVQMQMPDTNDPTLN